MYVREAEWIQLYLGKENCDMSYMPFNFSMSILMANFLCFSFHTPFFGCVLMTDLTKSSISFFCPLSSCREIEQKIKGSRTPLISSSSQLVTHMHRFCIFVLASSSMRLRSSAQGDWTIDGFKHSSKPSTMGQTGASPQRLSSSFKHSASELTLEGREPLL